MKKHISLFGYGKTTQALSSYIQPCVIYDDKTTQSFHDPYGNLVLPSCEFDAVQSELEIVSPGIPPSNPLVLQAKHIISEYDYFYVHAKEPMPPSIWISGSNGKTTTTEMMQMLFEAKNSVAGGNIGVPLALLDFQASWWILETSSFTLHYTSVAFPRVYVLLPVTQDHISWHGDFISYKNAKLKPLKQMTKETVAIIPRIFENDDIVKKSQSQIIFYDDSYQLAFTLGIKPQVLPFKEPFLQDALLALAAYHVLYNDVPYEKLQHFIIGKHRLEEHVDKEGRLWVNDSKATNVDASIQALKRYKDQKIHLIIGGDDKGADLTDLFAVLVKLNVVLYAIGSNEIRVKEYAKTYNITLHVCGELEKAVDLIEKSLKSDEVVLLSPAASSLDQFSSYQERGFRFLKRAGF